MTSQRRFKAYTNASVASLTAIGIDACRRILCECTNISSFATNNVGDIVSVIQYRPPAVTDVYPNGTLWIGYNTVARRGSMWLRCGYKWKIVATLKPVLRNLSDVAYHAKFVVKGDPLSVGNRQVASIAYAGYKGRSYPNPDVCFTNCNGYNISPLPGYDAHTLKNFTNFAKTYDSGRSLGIYFVNNLDDPSLGIVNIPIVSPTLTTADGSAIGQYYPSIDSAPKTMPIQSANYIQGNPFISRFLQYRINLPDGQKVPVESVRFLFLNNKIVPWIKSGVNGNSRGINFINTPAKPKAISSDPNEGQLLTEPTSDYYYFNTGATHVSMGFTPNGGNIWGELETRGYIHTAMFNPTREDIIARSIGSNCAVNGCESPYFQDGDIILQYYSHVRGAPGLYSDAELFDTPNISGYNIASYAPTMSQCGRSGKTGVSNPSGAGTLTHMTLLRFRINAGITYLQGGITFMPSTEYNDKSGFASYYEAFFAAPPDISNIKPGWNLTNRPNPYNAVPVTATPVTFTSCSSGTNVLYNNPSLFSVFNPALPSASKMSSSVYPFPGINVNIFKEGFSLHSKMAINNFGVTFYAAPTSIQIQIIRPDDANYIPLENIKYIMEKVVFINNDKINYNAVSPYKGIEKSLGYWLLNEMIDIQAQELLPLDVSVT